MYQNHSSDDYDFPPLNNSKLLTLFQNVESVEDDGSSLMYTAPKQPSRPTASLPQKPVKTSVTCVYIVNLWKLDKTYKELGRYGLAIISSTEQKHHELILYKRKDDILMRSKIHEDLILTYQSDFISFYDSKRQNWLVRFANPQEQTSFCDEIAQRGGRVVYSNETENPSPPQHSAIQRLQNDTSDSSDNRRRNSILTRMAKMGHSILPKSLDDSESDEDSEIKAAREVPKKMRVVKKNQNKQLVPVKAARRALPIDTVDIVDNSGAEMRQTLSEISMKLDRVLKINESRTSGAVGADTTLKSKIKALELQNENLATELQTISRKYVEVSKNIEEQDKISQRLIEAERIISQSTEKKIEESLVENYETELKKQQDLVAQLQKTIEEQTTKLNELQDVETKNRVLNDEIIVLKNTISSLESKINDNKSEFNVELNNRFVAELKGAMDKMFSLIMENFVENADYSKEQIRGVVAKNIKVSTFRIMDDFREICKT